MNKEIPTIQTGYCPWCGTTVTSDLEGEYGIFCPTCHNDFWFSETLPADWQEKGFIRLNDRLKDIRPYSD